MFSSSVPALTILSSCAVYVIMIMLFAFRCVLIVPGPPVVCTPKICYLLLPDSIRVSLLFVFVWLDYTPLASLLSYADCGCALLGLPSSVRRSIVVLVPWSWLCAMFLFHLTIPCACWLSPPCAQCVFPTTTVIIKKCQWMMINRIPLNWFDSRLSQIILG